MNWGDNFIFGMHKGCMFLYYPCYYLVAYSFIREYNSTINTVVIIELKVSVKLTLIKVVGIVSITVIILLPLSMLMTI